MFSIVLLLIYFQGYSCTIQKFGIPKEEEEKGDDYWHTLAKDDMKFALNHQVNNGIAKNIIIFVGDGMGITATTAGRIYKGQKKGVSGEEEQLIWETFPNVALIKTYNIDKQVPDSAATASAFFCGAKGNYYTLGVNGRVNQGNCSASLEESNRLTSILQWSQEAGKDTGFVTTTRVTHATPGALYCNSADRDWECDAKLPNDSLACKDIARQLVEDSPGKDVNVIFAGGRGAMGALLPEDKIPSCVRNDSRNLAEEWVADKHGRRATAEYVTTTQQLRDLDLLKTDYVMGLFGANHMPYDFERDTSPKGTPSLRELTEAAIKRLSRNKNGYFLMVEGGRIDHALHDTKPYVALNDLVAFEESVRVALRMVNVEETLVIVTADHSHVMTMNGYPERGNDILGTTTYEYVTDGMPYTTLMFTTGLGANFTWDGEKVQRANLTNVDTTAPNFISQSSVPTEDGYETHGGEDVATYATGPAAHLLHRVHEQSYLAHVMAFSACVGPFKNDCSRSANQNTVVHGIVQQNVTTEKPSTERPQDAAPPVGVRKQNNKPRATVSEALTSDPKSDKNSGPPVMTTTTTTTAVVSIAAAVLNYYFAHF